VNELGDTIKRRRLAMGQSRGQLASSLGTTATVVAALERGERAPDGETVALLAKTFGVDPHELTGEPPPPPTDGEMSSTDATAVVAAPMVATAPVAAAPVARRADPETAVRTRGDAYDGVDRIPVVAAEVASRPAGRTGTATGVIDGPAARPAELIEAQTEAVPVVAEPAPVFVVPAPATTADDDTGTGLYASYQRFLGVVFDRDKPYLFWLRTALTVIVLLVGLRVLAWALPAFFDALGDILSTIESTTPTPTTIPGA
jgi:transcriptional regulator with XRE-family HTH domain